MAITSKGKNRDPSFCTHVCITTAILFLWQSTDTGFFVNAAVADEYASTSTSNQSLRRANYTNITTSSNNYNHCNAKCITNIATGGNHGCLGFAGDDCSFPYEICPDTVTQCFGPMAVCVDFNFDDAESSRNYEQQHYQCDCKSVPYSSNEQTTSMMDDVLIRDCFDRVTEVCEKDQTVSSYAFCTNGGHCADRVEQGEPHPGCFCPGRFVGRHCETRRGTGREYRIEPPRMKVEEVNEVPAQKIVEDRSLGVSMSSTMIAVISSALAGFLVCAAARYKRFISRSDAPPPVDSNSKAEMSIHVPPYYGTDTVSVLE